MRYIYIISACFMLGVTSCNNGNTTANNSIADSAKVKPVTNTQPVQSKLNEMGTQKLMILITQYYTLKNALVATKASTADSAAMQLATITDSMLTYMHKDTTAATALKPFLDTIITQSKTISAIQDESCEKQRTAFSTLSSALYGLLKNVDLKNATVYQEHCPMALNEKGAYWLSDDSDIRNPYMGKKMMECGEVTDVIK